MVFSMMKLTSNFPVSGSYIKRIIDHIIRIILIIVLGGMIYSCKTKTNTSFHQTIYQNLYDIPGITKEDIESVENLRKQYSCFTFGALYSTEFFTNTQGQYSGFTVYLCDWLSTLFGIKFNPLPLEWNDLFPQLQTDFTGDLTATEQRRKEHGLIFSSSIAERTTKYFHLLGTPQIADIVKVRPLKIAFFQGSTTSIAAMNQLQLTAIPYEAVYLNDYYTIYQELVNKNIDVFIHEMIAEAGFDEWGNVVAEDFFPLILEPVSLTTQNVDLEPIIRIVNKALENDVTAYLRDLYEIGMQEHAKYKFLNQLSIDELNYIHENKTVNFLAEPDNYPVCFYNQNEKQWQGIVFDVLAEISLLTNLNFQIINTPNSSFSDLIQLLERGEGQMISELIRNNMREGQYLWSNKILHRDHYIAIALDSQPPTNVHRIMQKRIGVQKNSIYADLFHTWFPDHFHVLSYENINDAFRGLETEEIDLLIASSNVLLSKIHYEENPRFKANIIFNYTFDSSFGFHLQEQQLNTIVDKAMEIINIDSITTEWVNKTFNYRAKLIKSQRPWLIGAMIMFFLVIIFLGFVYLNSHNVRQQLDQLVHERTKALDFSQQELSIALQEAQTANKAKSKFLATMSHEIRTPLNAIIGLTQIQLGRKELPSDYQQALKKIYKSGSLLLAIINDILDLSKIETGNMEIIEREYDLPSLINDTIQINMVRIEGKKIEFQVDINENLPTRIVGDDLRIKQILSNLLSNAFKYTKYGYVKLSFDISIDNDETFLHFSVEDTGQGMKPESIQKLFSEYLRFNTETNKTTEGTGIGLSITKRLVELMGGEITVESQYGLGSTFRVKIKQQVIDSESIGHDLAQSLSDFTFTEDKQNYRLRTKNPTMPEGKILVVDDVETNLYVAEEILLSYELQIDLCTSGFGAIEKIESGKKYDIIFMDQMMPDMDGIETTQKLRIMGYEGVIVALTANALVGNSEMFKQKGFNDFISKPIDVRLLHEILVKYINKPFI